MYNKEPTTGDDFKEILECLNPVLWLATWNLLKKKKIKQIYFWTVPS